MIDTEQATGPRGQDGAPAAKRGRTVLTPGWRLLHSSPAARGRWAGKDSTVRRDETSGLAARLMYAGQNRRRALRRELPQTDRGRLMAPGHSPHGDRSCCGGVPAHGGGLARAGPSARDELGEVATSGGRLL